MAAKGIIFYVLHRGFGLSLVSRVATDLDKWLKKRMGR